jgi:SHAQKYF class myb-like DNA-binding protein
MDKAVEKSLSVNKTMLQKVLQPATATSLMKTTTSSDTRYPCDNDSPPTSHQRLVIDETLSAESESVILKKEPNGTTSPNQINHQIQIAKLSNGASTAAAVQPAPSRQMMCVSSTSNQVDKCDRATGDVNDMIASIAATITASSETINNTFQHPSQLISIERIDSKSQRCVIVDSTDEKETQQYKHEQQKERALHNRDNNTNCDDALLRDVPWTMTQHKTFVAAIFEVGLKTCSPSVIMENMRLQPRYITRERTKSHLQKYRITKDRNKDDFMSEYSEFMNKTEALKKQYLQETQKEAIPKVILSQVLDGKKTTKLIGGQAAALLSFLVLNNCSTDHGPDQIPFQGIKTPFPNLTEAEKQSSLGASLLYIKGLLHNMTDVLLKERHGIANIPISNSEEYDSSSYEDEDYSDFEEDERKPAALSNPIRKSSPVEADTSISQNRPGKIPHHRPYSYLRPYHGSPRRQYQQQPFAGQGPPGFHPPFPPFAFGGPQRPMQPHHGLFPTHRPLFSHGPFGHQPPPPHPMNHYPAGTPQNVPYAGPSDAPYRAYPNQVVHDQQRHNDAAFPSHFSNIEEPYHDMPEQESYGRNFDPVRSKAQESGQDWVANKNGTYHEKWRHNYDNDTDHPEDMFLGEKRNRAFAGDPTLFASPLVAERRRKRRRDNRVPSLDISVEIDEDRGIPGASKVASPFHGRHSPVRPRSKRADRLLSNSDGYDSRSGTTTRAARRGQSTYFLKSPHKEGKEVVNLKSHRVGSIDILEPPLQKTPQSSTRHPDKNLSPDIFFSGEPHLSPEEMSMVSKMSHDHDGHPLVWEPLAIDVHEHLLDQDRFHPPSGDDESKESRTKEARTTKSENQQIHNASSDSYMSTTKREFFFPERRGDVN